MAAAVSASSSSSPPPPSSSPIHLLATSSDVVKTWELNREAELEPRQEEFVVPLNNAHNSRAKPGPWHCVRWNHNSQVIAAGHETGAIALLHESGKVLEVLQESGSSTLRSGAPTPVLSLAWGGRSRYLCTTGADHCPSLWDLKRKECIKAFRGHQYPVTAVAFASDDSHVASGNNHGEILLHGLKSEEPAMVLPLDLGGGNGEGAPLTPSASIAAAVRSLNYWAMRQPLLLSGYRNGSARVWDTTTGTCLTSFNGQHQAAITAVVGSTVNNKLLATAGLDRRLILFDVNQRKLLRECKAVAPIQDMAFNADGDMILVACSNGDVSCYDLRKATVPCHTIHAHPGMPVRSLAVQHNASRAAAVAVTHTTSSSNSSSKTVSAASAQMTAAASTAMTAASVGGSSSSSSNSVMAPPVPPKTPVLIKTVAPKAPVLAVPPQSSTGTSSVEQAQQPRPLLSLSTSSTSTTVSSSAARPTSFSSSSSSFKPSTMAPAAAQRPALPRKEDKARPPKEEEEEEEEEDEQAQQSSHSNIEASSRDAAAAAAAAAAVAFTTSSKEMALQMEGKMKDMVTDLVADLRDEISTDLRALHLELLRTAETTQVAMQGLAATFQALVDENKSLRQEVEVLQRQMEMPY